MGDTSLKLTPLVLILLFIYPVYPAYPVIFLLA